MKKIFLLGIIFLTIFCIEPKETFAFSSSDYEYRNLCGNFEVATFQSNGTIATISCHSTYEQARNSMKSNGGDNVAIMTKVSGVTKIIDANVALLDLSVNPTTLTYFYNNITTSSAYTYMDTGSLYGGVDGAHIDTAYSSTKNKWMAKVKIGNYTGWIEQQAYEIVPIAWIKSSSSYTVANNEIRHNYVAKIQNTYNGSNGRTIGPKPEMLNNGTYYSYDGHYFYTSLDKLIKDYKNGNYNNSVNKSAPYYNYYMYLSNHTKTSYSSVNIDEYIRNNMGIKQNVYGNASNNGSSRLYGAGTFFYYAQEKYGVNAILSLSLSRNETGNGTSNLAINKNNGFGLNAVDSSPTESANWYASFASSILGYASKWITYGYAHPRDWRYFGPQFGDKWIGMNVKYASDTYWSEKMASNYYSLDKAFGLQDYNYYQLGVVTGQTNAYQEPSTLSKFIYSYPEAEDGVVIVDEITKNNEKWYKVVSDLNIDSNYNEVTSGDYNWNGYVYVKASNVKKINEGKNGNIGPNDVTQYQNKDYEYNLYVENTQLKPRVAITTKNTNYYYDSSLTSNTGKTLLKDKYVMVYTAAYLNNQPVAYLVTSDYWYDQKEWVSADSLKFTNTSYGKVSVTVSGNQYTWVNYNTDDAKYSLISGLYTNSYVPVLETVNSGDNKWYKVPVSLTNNSNSYGYTLSQAPGVSITLSTPVVENILPIINAVDKTIIEGTTFNALTDISATDQEDGNLTSQIKVTKNTVNTNNPGTYEVTYQVTDKSGGVTTKTIKVIVKENKAPVITAKDRIIAQNTEFKELENIKATDEEDGDLTSKIKVIENTVKPETIGEYKVVYKVTDSLGKATTKEIKVEVISQEEYEEDTSKDEEIDIDELLEKQEDGEFNLESLVFDKNTKKFSISGYLIILNQDNTNKEYGLLLVNKKDPEDVHLIEIDKWTEDTPYDLETDKGYIYNESWFKGDIDFTGIPNGDYDLYMIAATEDNFTIQLVDNYFNQNIDRRGENAEHGYSFKVNQKSKNKEIELSIRDELYTTSVAPTTRNMVNGYEDITFKNNKLYIYGYSYDYNGLYNNSLTITRKAIFENTDTYKNTVYDLGSTKGPFTIETLDKKDKTYAWYEKEIDISNLNKGTYSLLIYTKTSDAANYDELTDMFRSIKETVVIDNKTYTIYYNKNRNNRIELEVK